MLRHKTTFVIGAGASNEVGMPLGATLKSRIADLMTVEQDIWGDLKCTDVNREIFGELERSDRFKTDKRSLVAAARQISAGVTFASSIDNFLEIRKDDADITLLAKVALVHLILKGEQKTELGPRDEGAKFTLRRTAIDGKWYQEFAQLFFEKIGIDDLEDALSALSVIDFNYDRCFEQVFFHAVTGLYNLSSDRAQSLMAKFRLLHPYGSVGTLYSPRKDTPPSAFGSESTGRNLR